MFGFAVSYLATHGLYCEAVFLTGALVVNILEYDA